MEMVAPAIFMLVAVLISAVVGQIFPKVPVSLVQIALGVLFRQRACEMFLSLEPQPRQRRAVGGHEHSAERRIVILRVRHCLSLLSFEAQRANLFAIIIPLKACEKHRLLRRNGKYRPFPAEKFAGGLGRGFSLTRGGEKCYDDTDVRQI